MTDTPLSAPMVSIEDEMKKSYLDYAMSVIVSRALPDVRDGLKPVHRRILYAMKEGGYDSSKPYRKSARIVGDVMGKYHPHGDSAIYDAMVRMAQDFSLRLPLVDGQGNFGSMDGDPPAAMRYTEARLNKAAESMLVDIDKETVDWRPNYDDSDSEPEVLPAMFPNLLVNGAGGIAVGMATNIPTHNLGELIDACCAIVDNPDLDWPELLELVPGPDFPTGGSILGRKGILDAFKTGRGSIIMRAKTTFEPWGKDKQAIIVKEVPYQVNKATLHKRIDEVAREKLVEGIHEVRDESDRDGVRLVIELKKDIEPEIVLNQLYTHTALQTSFGVNTVALINGRPALLNLREILTAFIAFREEVITKRTIYELRKARERAHILAGLAVAVANIDEIIALIRNAPDPATARSQLMAREWQADSVAPLIKLVDEDSLSDANTYRLTETQAKAILDLRLHRLTGLEREKIAADLEELVQQIAEYLEILGSREKLLSVLKGELVSIKERFATPRRTEITDDTSNIDLEDLIQREEMAVTISHNGYIKRVPLSTYRAQKRGGKGRSGMSTRADDFVAGLFVASTHTPLLFFTTAGKVYLKKVYTLPLGTPQTKGKPIVNLLPAMAPGERIAAIQRLPEDDAEAEGKSIVFVTSEGNVRRNSLADFMNVKANGKIAMKLDNTNERLIEVVICDDRDDVLISTRKGNAIRFHVDSLRVFFSRSSTGVRGIKLTSSDTVIGMSVLRNVVVTSEEKEAYKQEVSRRGRGDSAAAPGTDTSILSEERFNELAEQEQFLLTVSELGFGKRTSAYEYRETGRGGQGIAAMEMTKRTGALAAIFPISASDEIMLVTNGGQTIRCPVEGVRIASRRTQGVTLFKVADAEKVVSVARLAETDEEQLAAEDDAESEGTA